MSYLNSLRAAFPLFIFLFSTDLFSQKNLFGLVTNDRQEIIPGATVFWKTKPAVGTATNENGNFNLQKKDDKAAILVVRFVGYSPTEVEILPHEDSVWVEISGITNMQEVVVTGSQSGSYVSTIGTRNVESIGSKEFKKAPCCNLSESFETTGSVDVMYSNAVTGTKEIRMLGLRGIYSQLMIESRPTLGGLAQPYAMELVPGTWLSGILVSKGASTVMNGFGGFTGSINVDLQKPFEDKPLFINGFWSNEGRGELNLHLNKILKNGWSHGLLTHADLTETTRDHNHDGFRDGPNKRQLNGLYRLFYESEPLCWQLNVQALTDLRDGGMFPGRQPAGAGTWLFDQKIDRVEVWTKLGFKNFKKPYNSAGNMLSASWHRMTGQFGNQVYSAVQKNLYWQSIYATILGNTNHTLNLAGSFQADIFEEKLNESQPDRREFVPGAEAEYTFSNPNLEMGISDWVVVGGLRLDYQSRFERLLATPRVNVKYNFNVNNVVRASAGRGFRSPNAVAENIHLLAQNRQFDGISSLKLEEAWNFGLNFTRKFLLGTREGSFSLDAFHTRFVNQAIIDQEADSTKILFYNLDGRSYSNSLLATFFQKMAGGFEIKLAAKIDDVKTTYQKQGLNRVPLVPKFRGLVSLDWESRDKKWQANARTGIIGQQRVASKSWVPHQFLHGFVEESPVYATIAAQLTRIFGKTEIYVGGENIGDFIQHAAIIAASDPFSKYFDASQLWAPTMGRTIYAGVRWSL